MSATYKHPRPAVTVDAVVITRGKRPTILLIQRGNPPFEGQWALPGGFLEVGENPEDAAARELQEETGLQGIEFTQIGAFGSPQRDPREHVISIAFLGRVHQEDHHPVAADDAAETDWFPLADLPPLAFDHRDIIAKGVAMMTSA